ncbi:hypothetical protein [Flavobacterium chungbukense]|uniref:YhhN-like protein n=1 Tax=Flavobacterium chungbukense TaxID=877464 RepID=A0ABP7XQ18_9FLAO|nr:hypothetical protein [Flavobacterium chungbukense]MCC4921026.1 hypothetical protein [Flavobacterium chungbukense]
MKPNKPSLILFFLALLCTILFDWTQQDVFATYAKAIILPAIFIYFLISSEFQIRKTEGAIFLSCFVGQVFDLMDIELGGVISFLIVYMLIVLIFIREHERIQLTKRDVLPISIVVVFIVYLLVSVLSIKLDSLNRFNFIYILYGIILSAMSYFCFVSYIIKGTHITLLMSLMAVSYIFSDIFYIFNEYFSYSIVLVLIRDVTQILAYYFMVEYFLEKTRIQNKPIQQ